MESIQTRRFCYSSWGKKRREFFVPSHFPTFSESFCLEAGKRFQFLQLFNQLLSLFLFRIFQVYNKLCLWNTRANGDATKANLFHALERNIGIKIEWISANRIALGLDNGRGIEIWQIDEEGETTNSRVIKQFKHGSKYVSLRISMIFQFTTFCCSFVEGFDI